MVRLSLRQLGLFCYMLVKGNEIDHWIFKKKKGKYDGYMADADKYAQLWVASKLL